jgi:hypothetical protein
VGNKNLLMPCLRNSIAPVPQTVDRRDFDVLVLQQSRLVIRLSWSLHSRSRYRTVWLNFIDSQPNFWKSADDGVAELWKIIVRAGLFYSPSLTMRFSASAQPRKTMRRLGRLQEALLPPAEVVEHQGLGREE